MTPRPGDLFANRFEIKGVAGSGGMGTIYRARDQLTGDLVALKLLHNQGSDGTDKERFLREAQLLAELQHPAIVAHVAHGQTAQGQRFLAMQWLDGEDLASCLTRGPMSLAAAITLTQRIATALAFAHHHGVVHRDIKPTNLFLPGGDISRVKLLDFGIARRLLTARPITGTGMIVGTPEYMAPEQARGVRELTPAADIFSLGCILYECLTGEPPFVGEHVAAVLVRILFEEPVAVTERRPGLPSAVAELLAEMLNKDPRRRLGDAEVVATRLELLGEQPNLPLLPTLSAPEKTPRRAPEGEQSLLSLVLALGENSASSATLLPEAIADLPQHETLLAALQALGTEAELLLGGALVVTVPQMPSAQDQALQAARVALLIQEHWSAARIAVVTGRGWRKRGLLTGEVLDRAFRLLEQSASASAETAPGTKQILIDAVSADLLDTRFELRPISGGFCLERERLEDAGRLLLGHPTSCVGRERELAALEAALTECGEESVARAVLILAPPGLGKSRLRHEFLRRLRERARQPLLLFGRGDPMKVKSSYGLLGEALRQHYRPREGQPPNEQQACLRDEISRHLPPAESPRVTEFLGELCGIPFPDLNRPQLRAARQEPRLMSDQVEQAWLDWLRAMTATQPVLLILEDLHWADALTIKLCQAALRCVAEQQLMVLGLARPEVRELYPSVFTGAVQELVLQPLPKRACERLVRQVLGPELAADVVTYLIERSIGNPLFLEELIRAAAQRKTSETPETVAAMLQARIGRLPTRERRILRAASVFGETFWEPGIRSLLGDVEEARDADLALAELIKEELIETRRDSRLAPELEYRFRHGLLRDAAYGLLSEQEATSWHAAAATFLERVGERSAGVLAEHYRLGRDPARAISHYVTAAEQAFDAHNIEASQSFAEQGLACGAQGAERGALLGILLVHLFFRGQLQEILALGPTALALLRPGSQGWCRAVAGFFTTVLMTGQLAQFPTLIAEILHTEPDADARAAYMRGLTWPSIFLYIVGQKEPADLLIARLWQVCAALGSQEHETWGYLWGVEANRTEQGVKLPYTNLCLTREAASSGFAAGNRRTACVMSVYYGKALFDLGQAERAEQSLRTTLSQAERIGEEAPLEYCRIYLARVLVQRAGAARIAEAEALVQTLVETQNQTLLGLGHGVLAQVKLHRGELAAAVDEARSACEILRPFPPYRLDIVALWSRILAAQGELGESLRVCAEMVQEIEALGLLSYGIIDLYVALAEAQLRCGDQTNARQTVAHALPILRRRVDDIQEAELRDSYLRKVPENIRLLELAKQYDFQLE